LAGKEFVTLDDLADEPIPRGHDPMWDAFWRSVQQSPQRE
jgi:hypothetical protein